MGNKAFFGVGHRGPDPGTAAKDNAVEGLE